MEFIRKLLCAVYNTDLEILALPEVPGCRSKLWRDTPGIGANANYAERLRIVLSLMSFEVRQCRCAILIKLQNGENEEALRITEQFVPTLIVFPFAIPSQIRGKAQVS